MIELGEIFITWIKQIQKIKSFHARHRITVNGKRPAADCEAFIQMR